MWKKKKAADQTKTTRQQDEQSQTRNEEMERDPAVRQPIGSEDLAWGDEGIDDPPGLA